MVESPGRRVAMRAREITGSGGAALHVLPAPEDLVDKPSEGRHALFQDLRIELYALSAIVADATVRRARQERASYPPYGLVRSRHSELRLVTANPGPYEKGSIDSFLALGKAFVDTTVFHLQRQLHEQLHGDQRWVLQRLEKLLSLFRVSADPGTRSRMRDASSFLYGGLHFGSGVCVQLAEVMALLLEAFPDLGAKAKAEIMARSSRPAFQLAALNFEHVIPAFQALQDPTPSGAAGRPAAQTWMDPGKFAVRHSEGGPWRIDLGHDDLLGMTTEGRRLKAEPTAYPTQGCPARISPTGGTSAIASLWAWCVELAHDSQLLGPATMGAGAQVVEPGPTPDPV